MPETDLYHPIRAFLETNGYTVRSEVKDCDMVAIKGDDLLIIELKQRFGMDLLVQATQRQRASDSVYVALPRSALPRGRKRWSHIRHLLRRLELGLILVDLERRVPVSAGANGDGANGEAPKAKCLKSKVCMEAPVRMQAPVSVEFHPLPFARRKNAKGRRAILHEVASRSGEYNRGGATSRERRVTAYRENAIQIAVILDAQGPLSPKRLRDLGTGPKTLSILHSNFYDWFDHVNRGLYALRPSGKAALATYPEMVARLSVIKGISEKT